MLKKSSGRRSRIDRAIASLGMLTDQVERRRSELAGEVGLSAAQWRVIEQISQEHFLPSLFAREQRCSAPAVSKVLRQLTEKDLIRVSISAEDGRRRQYRLTARGRRAMARLRASREEAIEEIWMTLPVRQVEAFADFTDELLARLQERRRRLEGVEGG